MLATSLFVAPASVDDLVEEVLQKTDAFGGLTHDTKPLARDDPSETSKPTSIDPTVVRRADGQVTGIDADPQWAENTPTAMFVQRSVSAVITADDPLIAVGNDDTDMTVLRFLSTLYSPPRKGE